MQLEGESKLVKRLIDTKLIECVSGPRKIYKHLKAFYKGFVEEQELNVLPDDKELDLIQQQAANDVATKQKEALNESNAGKEKV